MKTENEIIAEFMGGVRRTRVAVFADKDYDVYEFKHGNNPNPHANIGTEKRIEDLDYHKRWDWLMPVCQKLNMAEVSTDINKTYKDVLNRIMDANKGL